ncbi:hypothetical protein ACSVBT_07625 [Afipia sp. TerB]
MSWDRWFGKMEGLPNGRIGETARWPATTPKAKYDVVESRVATRMLVEKTGEKGPIGIRQIGLARTMRRSVEANPGAGADGHRDPDKDRK